PGVSDTAPGADLLARRVWRVLGLILLAGGVARFGLWRALAAMPLHIWDERDYNALALNLVRYGQFALTPGRPISQRPPLYPGAVAAIYELFGVENLQAVRLAQAGLSLLTVVLLYRIGAELYGRRTGVWLAGMVAFYPSLLGFNNL